MTTLPGLGVATPVTELLDNYRALVENLPDVLTTYPTAQVVRNGAGNLSIVMKHPTDGLYNLGHINVLTGEIYMLDEPWIIS